MNTLKQDKKDCARLVSRGNKIRSDFENLVATRGVSREAAERANEFAAAYQSWYSETCRCIGRIQPDRLKEFEALYLDDSKRKRIDRATYTIRDWFLDGRKPVNHSAAERKREFSSVVLEKIGLQCRICESVALWFKSSLLRIDAGIIDSSNGIDVAFEQDYIRFMTSVAGIFIASKELLFDGPETARVREVLLESLEKKGILIDV